MQADHIRKRILSMLALPATFAALLSPGITFAGDNLKWDRTFPQSDKVTHRKVSYSNRLGINLVADVYVPKNLDSSKNVVAIVVGPPFGGVKE